MNNNTNITIETIKARNKAAGRFYFEPATLRFFKSRVSSFVAPIPNSCDALFVTSEKGPNGIRRYTVRIYSGVTHECETAPGCAFQQFADLRTAKAFASHLATAGLVAS